ncbi:mucin-associated surface protein [Trypanosoma cruzi cruzi]|nr:mucin-associated surface protein [Trypanosoma cruzi cruzi]
MAMMTGRVLLVCALCVLWCLTGFGDARANRCIEGDGNVLTHTHDGGNNGLRLKADFGLISTQIGLIKAAEAGEREEEEAEIDNDSLEKKDKTAPGSEPAVTGDNETRGAGVVQGVAGAGTPSLPASGPGVSGTGAETMQLPVAGQAGNEKNNLDPTKKEPKEPQDQHTNQMPSQSGSSSTRSDEKSSSKVTSEITQLHKDTETELGADLQDNHESDETIEEEVGDEDKEQKQEINTLQPEKHESQNNEGPPQSSPAPPPPPTPSGRPAPSSTAGEGGPLPDQENLQKVNKVKNENTPSRSKTDSEATQPPPGDATQGQHSHDTDTEDSTKNAATGSPADTTTTSSTSTSGSGDHVHNMADEDDAQSSEEHHESIETGNSNVIPPLSERAPKTAKTTADAQTNGTVTKIGDSDSSTAVSHTTSPLLLLLVVACAAAAVVAA